jgi:hypothetical protein
MCLYEINKLPSTAVHVATKSFAISLLLFQWITCFMFIMSSQQAFVILGFMILSTAALILLVFWVWYSKLLKIFRGQVIPTRNTAPYIHPLEIERDEYLNAEIGVE